MLKTTNTQAQFALAKNGVGVRFAIATSQLGWIYKYYTLPINADTSINSLAYKKIHFGVQLDTNLYEQHYIYFTRYDSTENKVFVTYKDSLNEHLLYNFNAQLGHTMVN